MTNSSAEKQFFYDIKCADFEGILLFMYFNKESFQLTSENRPFLGKLAKEVESSRHVELLRPWFSQWFSLEDAPVDLSIVKTAFDVKNWKRLAEYLRAPKILKESKFLEDLLTRAVLTDSYTLASVLFHYGVYKDFEKRKIERLSSDTIHLVKQFSEARVPMNGMLPAIIQAAVSIGNISSINKFIADNPSWRGLTGASDLNLLDLAVLSHQQEMEFFLRDRGAEESEALRNILEEAYEDSREEDELSEEGFSGVEELADEEDSDEEEERVEEEESNEEEELIDDEESDEEEELVDEEESDEEEELSEGEEFEEGTNLGQEKGFHEIYIPDPSAHDDDASTAYEASEESGFPKKEGGLYTSKTMQEEVRDAVLQALVPEPEGLGISIDSHGTQYIQGVINEMPLTREAKEFYLQLREGKAEEDLIKRYGVVLKERSKVLFEILDKYFDNQNDRSDV